MRLIHEDNDSFLTLYEQNKGHPQFATANFLDTEPTLGTIALENGHVVGMITSTLASEKDGKRYYVPVWGFKKGHRRHVLPLARSLIKRHPTPSAIMTHCMDKTHPVYKASLNMTKKLGFERIAENEVCTIVKLEVH